MIYKMFNDDSRRQIIDLINKINLNNGKLYDVDISVKRKIRSIQQSRLYWLWLSCISDETGSDKDQLHEYFGYKYLPKEEKKLFGEIKMVPISTTKLNTLQFKYYLDHIQAEALTELAVTLPDPEDLHFREFYETYKHFI